jgi:hypothetical protein
MRICKHTKYFHFSILFIFSFLSISCLSTRSAPDRLKNKVADCKPILKTDRVLNDIPTDYLSVESLSILDNCLSIEISYGGGCGNYDLDLLFQESDWMNGTAVVNLKPVFIDNDPCRAIVLDTLMFDLSVFESVARSGGIRLNVFGTEKSILYALPLH